MHGLPDLIIFLNFTGLLSVCFSNDEVNRCLHPVLTLLLVVDDLSCSLGAPLRSPALQQQIQWAGVCAVGHPQNHGAYASWCRWKM